MTGQVGDGWAMRRREGASAAQTTTMRTIVMAVSVAGLVLGFGLGVVSSVLV